MMRAFKVGATGLFWGFVFIVVAPLALVLRDRRSGEFTDAERSALESIFPDPGVE